ncbi:DUF2945 domain-containing protein [Aspergillus clavatus NRRL 1]|uniref:Hypervirulence associated protein TUDOR domain-containing protein n=1 Tax=Aspergillus clavatus (strain ATCC 1007 / CBS 513.65 / DSM 816 / NCTC 3887 / NRRL 1 / QM 1276 / 107) TaxID=344612 RepID=A1CKV4_ASPCL|nr:uncharacterized protein ACLA_039940 [Aspergillus clavatus NRRL 1]EAW09778.1 conserved hypothetical protein [Aspergillus clavatus NRRL 1]
MPEFRKGDSVRYKPVGGPESHTSETVGVIREVSTKPTQLTGRNVAASEEEPRYEIENSHTHRRSAIKESNILGPAE